MHDDQWEIEALETYRPKNILALETRAIFANVPESVKVFARELVAQG